MQATLLERSRDSVLDAEGVLTLYSNGSLTFIVRSYDSPTRKHLTPVALHTLDEQACVYRLVLNPVDSNHSDLFPPVLERLHLRLQDTRLYALRRSDSTFTTTCHDNNNGQDFTGQVQDITTRFLCLSIQESDSITVQENLDSALSHIFRN